MAEAGRSCRASPCPSPLKQDINIYVRGALLVCGAKEPPCLQRRGDAQRNPNKQAMLSLPTYYTAPFPASHPSMFVCSLSTLVKNTQILLFFGVFISLGRLLCHVKLILNKCI